jgi:hypothetical protein
VDDTDAIAAITQLDEQEEETEIVAHENEAAPTTDTAENISGTETDTESDTISENDDNQ